MIRLVGMPVMKDASLLFSCFPALRLIQLVLCYFVPAAGVFIGKLDFFGQNECRNALRW
jgi:hypothetical protein